MCKVWPWSNRNILRNLNFHFNPPDVTETLKERTVTVTDKTVTLKPFCLNSGSVCGNTGAKVDNEKSFCLVKQKRDYSIKIADLFLICFAPLISMSIFVSNFEGDGWKYLVPPVPQRWSRGGRGTPGAPGWTQRSCDPVPDTPTVRSSFDSAWGNPAQMHAQKIINWKAEFCGILIQHKVIQHSTVYTHTHTHTNTRTHTSTYWWLFSHLWGFWENVQPFIPFLCFFFFWIED